MAERFIPDWIMGFEEIDEVVPGPGLSFFVPRASTPGQWIADPDASLALFECCRHGAADG